VPHCGSSRPIVAISSRTSEFRRGRPKARPERRRQNRRQPRQCQPSTVSGRTRSRWRCQFRWRRRTRSQKSSSQARRRGRCWGAEGDRELLAEEQVLDDQALTAADAGDEGGQDEPDELEHRGRIAGRTLPPYRLVRLRRYGPQSMANTRQKRACPPLPSSDAFGVRRRNLKSRRNCERRARAQAVEQVLSRTSSSA
jgi:hypothetical protein